MKLIRRIFLLLGISLLCSQVAFAVEWDGKSPMWVGTLGCPIKIGLSIMDKMSVPEEYEIEYVVSLAPDDKIKGKDYWTAKRHYVPVTSSIEVVFPDDFSLRLHPELKAYPICYRNIYWSIYANGRKISAGVITNEVTHAEVSGKLISTKRK